MRHIVHLMLGNESESLLKDLKKYIVKYNSEEEESKYFSALLYSDRDDSSVISQAILEESDKNKFISGLEDLFTVSLSDERSIPQKNRGEYLRAYFTAFSRMYSFSSIIKSPPQEYFMLSVILV